MTIRGTMRVRLTHEVSSANGKRRYRKGAVVLIAIAADSSVRVWRNDEPPVLASFKEVVGSELL